ncbi:hypothetical protein ACK9YZ_23630 [Rhizobium sp. ZK1]|uniref:hypothetical protein n=1 Tax=Rhizobium sp. ZK1 TaxID=3389872 RepID=UPI0039F68FA1
MAYEVLKLDGHKRAAAKQASRDEDVRRVASGEISDPDLKRENSFFGSLDKSKFRMVAIGGKPIARKM